MSISINNGIATSLGSITDNDLSAFTINEKEGQTHITAIWIENAQFISNAGLMMLPRLRQLVSVKFVYLMPQRIENTTPYIPRDLSDPLYTILTECANLRNLYLTLTDVRILSASCFEMIATHGQDLECLMISGQNEYYEHAFDPIGIRKLNELKNLIIFGFSDFPHVPFKEIVDVAAELPKLQALSIQGGKTTTDKDVIYLLSKIKRLTLLTLEPSSSLTKLSLAHLASSPLKDSLQILSFTLRADSKGDWRMIASFVQLMSLQLFDSNIDYSSLLYLSKQLPKLKKISLTDCDVLEPKQIEELKNSFQDFNISPEPVEPKKGLLSGWI